MQDKFSSGRAIPEVKALGAHVKISSPEDPAFNGRVGEIIRAMIILEDNGSKRLEYYVARIKPLPHEVARYGAGDFPFWGESYGRWCSAGDLEEVNRDAAA